MTFANPVTIPDVFTALRNTLTDFDGDVYDCVPDSINPPCIGMYVEDWPFDWTAEATVILWCIAGATDERGAQERLGAWLSDSGTDSLVSMLDADNRLGGVVSSVRPANVRNWGAMQVQEGRARLLQAELVLAILR